MAFDILGFQIFGNRIISIIFAALAIIASVVAGRLLYWISKNVITKLTSKTKSKIDDIILDMIEEPLAFTIVLIGIYLSLGFLILPSNWDPHISKGFKALIIINIIWFVSRFLDSFIENYLLPLTEKSKSDLDDQILPIVRGLSRILVWSIGILFLLSNLGINVTSLVAGMGIGGLAIAFAIKDMLAHFFGGVTVLTDKPFKIGQRIRVAGSDGIVKEIGIRSTKITTLDGTELIIPNGTIADSVVENVSREAARKITFNIGVEYATSVKKLEQAKKLIQDIILKNQSTKDESRVFFDSFGDFSLNIKVIYWIKDLERIFEAKDEINFAIKKEFEKAKIEMAFPTQTVIVKK